MARTLNRVIPSSLQESMDKVVIYNRRGTFSDGIADVVTKKTRPQKRKETRIFTRDSREAAKRAVKKFHPYLSSLASKEKEQIIFEEIKSGIFDPEYFVRREMAWADSELQIPNCNPMPPPGNTNNQNPPIFRTNCVYPLAISRYNQTSTFDTMPEPSLGWSGSAMNNIWSDDYLVTSRNVFDYWGISGRNENSSVFFEVNVDVRISASWSISRLWPRLFFYYNPLSNTSPGDIWYPIISQYKGLDGRFRQQEPQSQQDILWSYQSKFYFSLAEITKFKIQSSSVQAVLHIAFLPPFGKYFGPNVYANLKAIPSSTIYIMP